MKHNCSSLIIHCMDFRIGPQIQDWLKIHGLFGETDIISVAGAIKNIVSPQNQEEREFIIRQCNISKQLHGTKQFILLNHTDCGSYEGKDAFRDRGTEISFHTKDLKEAAIILQKHFPEIEIKCQLAEIKPTGEISFIEILR